MTNEEEMETEGFIAMVAIVATVCGVGYFITKIITWMS